MTCRYSALAGCLAHLLLACGGEARPGSGGSGGSPTTAAGQSGLAGAPRGGSTNGGAASGGAASGGSTHGGAANGGSTSGGAANGSAGGPTVCCAAFPTCPSGERLAESSECPGHSSCHQVALCCSSIWCVNDGAGGAAGTGGGASHDCDGATCSATQACIAYRTVGGALFAPDDTGACPSGKHLENARCQANFSYKCAELHGACDGQAVSCACAQPASGKAGVCPAGFGSCSSPGANADASAQLVCQQLAP